MKILKPSFSIVKEESILKKLEQVGRTCYKSEDKITDESAKTFISSIVKRQHEAMIEHYTFVLNVSCSIYKSLYELNAKFLNYSETKVEKGTRYLVSGSARGIKDLYKSLDTCHAKYCLYEIITAILEKEDVLPLFLDVFEYNAPYSSTDSIDIEVLRDDMVCNLTKEERLIHQFISVRFICDRGVSHELVRHRVASFGQESTRYCNYSSEKFGSEINVIDIRGGIYLDNKMKDLSIHLINAIITEWENAMEDAERHYNKMIQLGASAQIARSVLPTDLKTEIVVTLNNAGWRHFFSLRADTPAHSQMRELAIPLLSEFKEIDSEIYSDVLATTL